MTLSDLLSLANAGQPLWLPDLRGTFLDMDGADVVLRLRMWDGAVRDWRHRLPRWKNAAERDFVRSCLCANVYNALSVCGGRELAFFLDPKETEAAALLAELDGLFRLRETARTGLGRVVNIAERMGRAFGGGAFRFTVADMDTYAPAPPAPEASPPDLPGTLRRIRAEAESKNLIGIDVGGTDIKLAASARGRLVAVKEYDWNPAASPTAEGVIGPILDLLREMRAKLPGELDGVGVSFPDIVLRDRIVGGETPKTDGMRHNAARDYEAEFAKLTALKDAILPLCGENGACRVANDGNVAAFTAAMERMDAADIRNGVLAHTLGTDLGTGWLKPDGTIPEAPLELYDILIDLGSFPSAALPPEDLRSTRNENSGLAGARRYLGQAAAWRLAYEYDPELVRDFVEMRGDTPVIRMEPEDLRKPCLAHLMALADAGRPAAEAVFRQIGRHLAAVSREAEFLLSPETGARYLFGRFVKSQRCFELICEGFQETAPRIRLERADETLANTPLMRQLAALPDATVAQFGQAVGALYFALS